eukprot:SAG31_NODE_476_length_15154_cov_24.796878_5_plen_332_part_00
MLGSHLVAAAANAAAAAAPPPPPQLPPDPIEFVDPRPVDPNSGSRWNHSSLAEPYAAAPVPLDRPEELAQHVRDFGWVVLRGLVPVGWVDECAAAFLPRMQEYVGRKGANDPETRNRGPFRHYIDLPMCQPFSTLMANQVLARLLLDILGDEACCVQFASDTPLGRGSCYQMVHGDLGEHEGQETYYLAVNWPLVDVGPENGPFEMAVGTEQAGGATHRLHSQLARATVESGRATLQRLFMQKGDVLVRDPRVVHRASPNLTDEPRPMLVMGIDRRPNAVFKQGRHGTQTLEQWERMSALQRRMLRVWPRTMSKGERAIADPTGSNGYTTY